MPTELEVKVPGPLNIHQLSRGRDSVSRRNLAGTLVLFKDVYRASSLVELELAKSKGPNGLGRYVVNVGIIKGLLLVDTDLVISLKWMFQLSVISQLMCAVTKSIWIVF